MIPDLKPCPKCKSKDVFYARSATSHPAYRIKECVDTLLDDALVYIQQLEADNAQQARCIENLTDKLNATNDALPRWISVGSEEKPKHCKEYLCLCTLPNDPMHEWDYIAVLRWNGHGGNGYVNGPHFRHEGLEGMKVTHWMPLPEPPKEERC